jgi:hypothetical protein
VFIWIQQPKTCAAGTCAAGTGSHFNPSEPFPALLQGRLSQQQWTAALDGIRAHVSTFRSEARAGQIFYGDVLLMLVLMAIEPWAVLLSFVIIPVHIITQNNISQHNQAVDVQIAAECQQLSDQWAKTSLSASYQTMHTQCCRQKHSRPTRFIAINVANNQMAAAAKATMGVTVPADGVAGQSISVQTPHGNALSATIPLGMAPGSTMTVEYTPPHGNALSDQNNV